ncbi:MAG: DEAD/DEAH box helicase [Tannerella sp.]|jgi:SNF2 family DNA or RNA helicase|nr:DEAD/DEAH box helicase [Tannerella sp.]
MLDEQIQEYLSLDDETQGIIHHLALTRFPMSFNDICWSMGNIKPIDKTKLQEEIDHEVKAGLIGKDPLTKGYILNNPILVWVFPLIPRELLDKRSGMPYYGYRIGRNYGCLQEYLKALCHAPDQLAAAEKELLLRDKEQVGNLVYLFSQPAYDEAIPRLSATIVGMIYGHTLRETASRLDSFALLEQLDSKLQNCEYVEKLSLQAEAAIIQGDFKRAQQLSLPCEDEPVTYFSQAISTFLDGRTNPALELFEKGLRKQRHKYKDTHLPGISEAALFYIVAWFSKEQEKYAPVLRKIADEKVTEPISSTYLFFKQICEHRIETAEKAAKMAVRFRKLPSTAQNAEQLLWTSIVMGFAGKPPASRDQAYDLERRMLKAVENRYYVIAYEIAGLLVQWFRMTESLRVCEQLGKQLGYAPLLSRIKPLEDWERQLNTYLSLDAVQSVIRQESDNGNTRLAYRFHFDGLRVYPVLQTRNAKGEWSEGKVVTLANFAEGKVDCMTEQDRRIAACETKYSYAMGRNAIREMIGHPYIFLEDSGIHVELIAAQPTLNVVKVAGNYYRIECDIPYPHEGVMVLKETNTRYKVYNLNKFQNEILQAVSNCRPIPEQGYDKLLRVAKHFSVHLQVQSDLPMDEIADQLRQIDADTRIRVQLLPLGDGLKAELFAKPFGTHPPYCKPGRGGRTLIANENDERVQATRDLEVERANNDLLYMDIRSIKNVRTTDGSLMTFNNPLDSLELLDVLKRHQDICVVEWPEGERLRIRRRVVAGDLRLRVKSNVNWFELEGELKVDEEIVLSLKSLLELVRAGRGRFIELGEGEFLALSEQLRSRLAELEGLVSESKSGVVLNRFASASVISSFDEFENLQVDKAWLDFRKRLEAAQQSEPAVVPPLLQTELRPYQTTGFQWMIRLSEWGAGACLADDMGLGKTVQAIAVLLHRMQEGPALVLSPVSVTQNWVSEVNSFAPALRVKTLHDNGDRAATLASLEAGDLLVTSYGLLLSEEETLTAKHWATVILDEAHAIKNYNTKTSKAAMNLQADFRIILTGTPLQNHLGELWNLFQFINPGLLGDLSHFNETFVRPTDERTRERLKNLITPFILRRIKTDVLKELPPKTEIVWKITLSSEEAAFYETLRRKAVESLESDDSPQGGKHIKVLAEITRLRQACCHPALVSPEIGIESTKLSTFLQIASELKDNGHRALVFSQFVTHLTIVRQALDQAGFSYCYLDGSTQAMKRIMEVRAFQGGTGDFFLISLKAGGLGLNLTAADYVIHLDPWWNPAIEDQASDRAYRIGQLRPVTVYRLVAKQTIEEKIIQLHSTKRDLAESLLEGSDRSAKLSIDELMDLIKER